MAEAERALLRADEFEENKPYSETSLGNHFKETGHHELAEEYFAKAVGVSHGVGLHSLPEILRPHSGQMPEMFPVRL